jgi:hypothetical protein
MLLGGLGQWQPSIYPTTGFPDTSIADQINIHQILNGMTEYSTMIAQGLGGQTTSPRDTAWYPNIAQATGMRDLLGMRIASQGNNREEMPQPGSNGYASTYVRDPGEMTSPWSNGWNPRGSSAWQPTISQATGPTGMRPIYKGDILEAKQNGSNWFTGTVARGQIQATNPGCRNAWSPRWSSSTLHPTVTRAAGLTGHRTADQDYILETLQNNLHLDAMLALDLRQATTGPCRKELHTAVGIPVHDPIDQTIARTGKLIAEEADSQRKTARKGKWTADEDKELLRAVEKFSVTRWKQIAALIPGRTKKQCWNRWQYALDPSVVRMTERTGKWLAEEDEQLVAAVEKYSGKNWDAIAAQVPSRTKRQCLDRWHKCKSGITTCAED